VAFTELWSLGGVVAECWPPTAAFAEVLSAATAEEPAPRAIALAATTEMSVLLMRVIPTPFCLEIVLCDLFAARVPWAGNSPVATRVNTVVKAG